MGSDAALIAAMFHRGAGPGDANSAKRADFIVSISNEGWFGLNEHAQHLQAEMFRCIENRAPHGALREHRHQRIFDSDGRVQSAIRQTRLEPLRKASNWTGG